jgi:hypothetical protein
MYNNIERIQKHLNAYNIFHQTLEKYPVGLKNAVVYPHSGFVTRLMNFSMI